MRIGIDLGGTKTEIICLNESNGKELYRQRVPSPKNDYKKTIENIVSLIKVAEKTLNSKGTVGVGIPGSVSEVTGKVKNANSTWLNGQAFDVDLAQALGREVRVENDANCFALSEFVDGAGAGYNTVYAVIIGTGCGAGVVSKGNVISGVNGVGGEWGHNVLPIPRVYKEDGEDNYFLFDSGEDKSDVINPTYTKNGTPLYFTTVKEENEYPGPQCYCGKRGCLETWISGTGFKNDYSRVTGEDLSTHDIIAASQNGEERAVQALYRYADRLARGLSSVINVVDPDVIILGGGMGNVKELYSLVPEMWKKYIISDTVHTQIVPPRHGDSSGVRGAAWLWND